MPTLYELNTSTSLVSTVRNVWRGDEHAIIHFKGSLPPNVGNTTSANVVLFCLARDCSTIMCAFPSSLKLATNKVKAVHPFLAFDQSVPNPFALKDKHSSMLCSYLASAGGTVEMTVKLDLKSLPDHINTIKVCLQLRENHCTDTRDIRLYSNVINILQFKLCIQTLTMSLDEQKDGNSDLVEWFFKYGGDNKSIDVMIHLKDPKGRIVNDYPNDIQLCTELVYEDGTQVVSQTQNIASNSKNGSVSSSIKVFRRMRPEPIIEQGTGSIHFAFRIEQVSTNHKPHIGFKLKVSPASADAEKYCDIIGSLTKETIIVKSRPFYKSTGLKSVNVGGRSTILQKALGGIPIYLNATHPNIEMENYHKEIKGLATVTREHGQASRVLSSKNPFKIDQAKQLLLFHPSNTNSFFANNDATCLSCGEYLKRGHALNPMEHKMDCRLYMTLCQALRCYTRSTAAPNDSDDSIENLNDLKKPANAACKHEEDSEE